MFSFISYTEVVYFVKLSFFCLSYFLLVLSLWTAPDPLGSNEEGPHAPSAQPAPPCPHPMVSEAFVSVTKLISELLSKSGMAQGWPIKTFCLCPMSVAKQV